MRIHSDTMPRTYKPKDQARRYAENEEALRADGGRRVNVRLRGDAVKALQLIQIKHGISQTEAIHLAILRTINTRP